MSYDMMKKIVSYGSNLELNVVPAYDLLKELVSIAKRTGARITLQGTMSYELMEQLASVGGNQVTFVVPKS